ncbi:MAG TPA: hypothetical protein PLW65_15240 [Pseudomonadota bacterium]|nr:hypothetical protein [Pseudomonadota bacterium]
MRDPLDTDGEFEPEQRALCPDGACLGVLDDSGRCKVCGQQGTPAAADPDAAAAEAVTADVPVMSAGLAVGEPDPRAAAETAAAEPGDDFADRQLCSDPSCIGVLDASGCCKECGRKSTDPLPA